VRHGATDMPQYDLSLSELESYRSSATPPEDLAEFWDETLTSARAVAAAPRVLRADTGLRLVETFDVTFSGFGGDPVRAWLHRPVGVTAPLPVVVRYQGYGGGRGLPHSVGLWPLAGYACLEVDTRGQGSAYSPGDTTDPHGSGPAHPGYLTRGILDPQHYYYRRVFTDAVLAVDAVLTIPGLDPTRVAVAGGSQGGGIAIAVASLRSDLRAVLSDVPFLSDFRRASEIATDAPYSELTKYLSVHPDHIERAFATLAYFDAAVLGARASAPALFSVALMDETCPPSTVYAAFHAYGGPKELRVWPFNDHEGGHSFQEAEQLAFLRAQLG
jgi:cephalosporin-C deacetylase